MSRPLEVQFDTSALSNLLQSDIAQSTFDDLLGGMNAVVVNNSFSIGQCFVDRDNARVRLHLRRLGELGFERFGGTVSIECLRKLELRGEPPSATPTLALPLQLLFAAPDELQDFDDIHLDIAAEILTDLDASVLIDADQRLAAAFRAPTEAERRLRHALKNRISDSALELVDIGSSLVDDFLFVDDASVRELMHRQPSRYRVHVLTAAMIAVQTIGSYLSDAHTPERPWLKFEKDNWNDLHVVATAAYADVLVTDDVNMRGRIGFLRERGLAFVHAVSLSDLLAGRFAQPEV